MLILVLVLIPGVVSWSVVAFPLVSVRVQVFEVLRFDQEVTGFLPSRSPSVGSVELPILFPHGRFVHILGSEHMTPKMLRRPPSEPSVQHHNIRIPELTGLPRLVTCRHKRGR